MRTETPQMNITYGSGHASALVLVCYLAVSRVCCFGDSNGSALANLFIQSIALTFLGHVKDPRGSNLARSLSYFLTFLRGTCF